MITKKEKSLQTLAMLRYKASHYQSIGYGARSQAVLAEIRRLVNELKNDVVEN
jgi:hypothetical protein